MSSQASTCVNPWQLARAGRRLEVGLQPAAIDELRTRLAAGVGDQCKLIGHPKVTMAFSPGEHGVSTQRAPRLDAGEELELHFVFGATLERTCQRCLEPFTEWVETERRLTVRSGSPNAPEVEVVDDRRDSAALRPSDNQHGEARVGPRGAARLRVNERMIATLRDDPDVVICRPGRASDFEALLVDEYLVSLPVAPSHPIGYCRADAYKEAGEDFAKPEARQTEAAADGDAIRGKAPDSPRASDNPFAILAGLKVSENGKNATTAGDAGNDVFRPR